jgi:PHD/YefM family antitoxin component YafN of YafNO toxin-antitoxin module
VITQHGKPAGVLVSPEDFDRMSEHSRFLQAVERGLDDVKAGRVVDDASLDSAIGKTPRSKVKK